MADIQNLPTIISPNMKFSGEIFFDTDLVIYGNVTGKLVSEGGLVIKENAEFQGDVFVQHVNIQGKIQGNINKAKEVNISSSAMVYGDIETMQLSVAKGSKINGTTKMK